MYTQRRTVLRNVNLIAPLMPILIISLISLMPCSARGQTARLADAPSCVITPENSSDVELLFTLTEHTDGVWNAVFSPDGSLLATCAQDQLVLVREVDNLTAVTELSGHFGWVLGLAFSPDGQLLASAGTDGFSGSLPGYIRLWDLTTDTQVDVLAGHAAGTWSLDFQESSGILVSGGRDMTVRLWDPSTGDLLNTLTGHTGIVLSVDFNPYQDLVASSGTDNSVRIWNSQTGESVFVLTGHTNNVGFVKFSPDGTRLASSADDGTVRMWDVATGEELWVRPAGQSWVNGVNFSPNGDLLLTCGHDGSVALRDTADGAQLMRFDEHTAPVLRGGFNPAGTMFATASWDNTVRIWGIKTGVDSTTRTPLAPDADDNVNINTYLLGCRDVQTVTLHYDSGSGYQALSMFDDGLHDDGLAGDLIYGASLPPSLPAATVRYYVSVTDDDGLLTYDPPDAPVGYYEYTVNCCGGYTGGYTGNTNCSADGLRTLSDITKLIDRVYISKSALCCEENGNTNGDPGGAITLSDITVLIDHVFVSKTETAPRQ
jgi:WD40 repeat protein